MRSSYWRSIDVPRHESYLNRLVRHTLCYLAREEPLDVHRELVRTRLRDAETCIGEGGHEWHRVFDVRVGLDDELEHVYRCAHCDASRHIVWRRGPGIARVLLGA